MYRLDHHGYHATAWMCREWSYSQWEWGIWCAARQITARSHCRVATPGCAEKKKQAVLIDGLIVRKVEEASHRSCVFIPSSFALHTAVLCCASPRFLPPSQQQTSHKSAHMAASHQEWVSWQAAGNLRLGSFHHLKATPHYRLSEL